jgi:hypothetical protein
MSILSYVSSIPQSKTTYMTPKTPPGPNCWEDVSIPGQAANDLASKKYEHSSSSTPMNEIATLGALGSVGGSLSHRKDIIVDFRLVVSDFESDDLDDLDNTVPHGDPCV